MSSVPIPQDFQQLAFAYQEAQTQLKAAQERTRQLLEEIDRLNGLVDRIQNSKRAETDNRLRAEEALGDTRERLQIAVDASGLVLWDFKRPFTDFFISSKWGEVLGEVALEGYWELDYFKSRLHPEDLPAFEQGMALLLAADQEREVVEFRFKAHGEWLWIESRSIIAQRDEKRRPVRIIGTFANISNRKQYEKTLAQAREVADLANRAKSDLITNISHDIRTPLNAIMGLNSLLLDTVLTDDQRQWLELMKRSSQSLLKLLNDLLDLSRIEARKLSLDAVAFELRPLLDSICGLYMTQAQAKDILFVKRFAPKLPPQIVGDAGRLEQILSNLLSNAIKFTEAGGRVSIDAYVIGANESARLSFIIQDSGIGIEQAVIEKLFQSFTQADASIASRFGGSGMGLAICANLVELMGGTVRVESKLGQGSRFLVNLPLRLPEKAALPPTFLVESPAAAPVAAAAIEAPSLSGLKVLLAEDHPVNELVMRKMLVKLGCEVDVAHNGNEAVSLWQQSGYDIILMDIQMPECNGLMASERIRTLEQDGGLSRTPIVALTANAMSGDRDRCLAVGMDAHVVKPVKMDNLVQVMQSMQRDHATAQHRRLPPPPPPPPPLALPNHQRPAAQSGARDFDLSGLSELSEMIGADLKARLSELDEALASRDVERALVSIHKLKSTAGMLKAERSLRLCRGLEMAASAGEWNLFSRALPLLHAEVAPILARGPAIAPDPG